MSYDLALQSVISLTAASDLSGAQYKFVGIDSTSQAKLPDSTAFVAIGIVQNQPTSGANALTGGTTAGANGQIPASVAIDGVSRLRVAGAYSAGTYLVPQYSATADEAGRGIAVSDASGGGSAQYARAYTLQSSSAVDDIIAVKLIGLSGLVS